MTPEERIAQLEADLERERARADGLQEIVHALTVKRRSSGAERQARYRERHDVTPSVTSDVTVTRHAPSPSLPPPFPSPSLSAPISPPPISSPNPSSPPSFSLSASETLPGKPAKKAKEAKKETTDPRHAPLSLALVGLGWPHHGGRTAKAMKDLLALADQVPTTAGDKAQAEILRRAAKAKASTGFPQVRELHELATHWGHFSGPPAASSALPRADDPDWVTV